MNHYIGIAVFVPVMVLNHRLNLQLTVPELVILAAVLGVHQVTSLVKLLKLAPEKTDDSKPA